MTMGPLFLLSLSALARDEFAARVSWCALPETHEKGLDELEDAITTLRRCGFLKLRRAVEPEELLALRSELRALVESEAGAQLTASLRPSHPLDGERGSSWLDAAMWWHQEPMPWVGGSGRAMLDMPFAEPFNRSQLVSAAPWMGLVRTWLADAADDGQPLDGDQTLGVAVEQAAYIAVGPRTGRQQAHSDSPHMSSMASKAARGGTLPNLPHVPPAPADPPVLSAFERLRRVMDDGGATFSLNVQLPLVDVRFITSPTHAASE
jgi:hypothetical protein